MSHRAFDAKLAALSSLRSSPDPENVRAQLGKALTERNNYLVARAAALVAELKCDALIPDLVTAFDRFLSDPVKSDPQCLAKAAIAEALRSLGHRDPAVYVGGIAHVQFEPAFGGRVDTAAALRGTCALALPDSHLDDLSILTYLTDALADAENVVRIDSAIGINNLGRPEGAVLLRLKLLVGDPEADVLGHCFIAFLNLAPPHAIAFVSRFLRSANGDVRLEAAGALAQCRDPAAIAALEDFWLEALLSLEARRALLISLGASPLAEAAEFLLRVVSSADIALAATAITTLAASRYRAQLADRVAAAVETIGNPRLVRLFEDSF